MSGRPPKSRGGMPHVLFVRADVGLYRAIERAGHLERAGMRVEIAERAA